MHGNVTDAGDEYASYSFDFLKLDKLANLYMVYVTDASNDVGTARGARIAKFEGGIAANDNGAVKEHLGLQ